MMSMTKRMKKKSASDYCRRVSQVRRSLEKADGGAQHNRSRSATCLSSDSKLLERA